MSSQSQKTAVERTRTRGKSLTAGGAMADNPPSTPSQLEEPTLAAIMKRLDKLDALDTMQTKMEKMEEKMETMEQKINTITDTKERLDDLAEKTEAYKNRTDKCMDGLAARIEVEARQHDVDTSATNKITEMLTRQMDQLKCENKAMEHKLNDIENKAKECNILIEGKREEEGENIRDYVHELASRLTANGIDPAAILTIRRIGKKQQNTAAGRNNRPRVILVTFRSVQERNTVYYARTRLRDIQAYKAIYLNDDTTIMTRKLREDYRSVAALVRSNGLEVRLHDDGIVIQGNKFKHSEIDRLPRDFTIQKAKTRQIDNGLYFQSGHSFLSNFHPAPINSDDHHYPTAEHRFQAAKCIFAKDARRHELVLSSPTPLDAKRIGDQITETSEWRNQRETVLKETIDLKFNQNPELAQRLIETRQLTLHEATTNSYYGIGVALHSRDLRNKQFSGLNKLGIALETKRTELIAAQPAKPAKL